MRNKNCKIRIIDLNRESNKCRPSLRMSDCNSRIKKQNSNKKKTNLHLKEKN